MPIDGPTEINGKAGNGRGEGAVSSPHAVGAWLERNARRRPDGVLIHSIDQDKRITHGEMVRLAARIARFLRARGVGANDRIALLSNNALEHLAVYLGVMGYGATICTVHVEMNRVHFEDILKALGARIVLYEAGLGLEDLRDRVPGEWIPLGEWRRDGGSGFFAEIASLDGKGTVEPVNGRRDVASIFYTSGTEAQPKGVVCSFAELLDNVVPTTEAFAIGEDDRVLDCRSFNWMSAQVLSALGPLAVGGTLLLARKFSTSRFFDWVRDHGATIAAGNPTILNMLANGAPRRTSRDLPTLRFVTSSSAPLLPEQWKAFEDGFGIPVCQGYGSSETGWIAGSNEKTVRFGTVGLPLPYHRLAVVGATGESLPPEEPGAVELGGDPGGEYRYLAEDGAVRVNCKGRIRTGDTGVLTADGYLRVTGRIKDLIIRGGVNISPLEIDGVLLQLPEVAEAAAVGVPDPVYGEEVVVYVALKDGVTADEKAVIAHCRKRLAQAKLPKEVIFRDSLPKTDRGKMDRATLAEEWKQAHRVG